LGKDAQQALSLLDTNIATLSSIAHGRHDFDASWSVTMLRKAPEVWDPFSWMIIMNKFMGSFTVEGRKNKTSV